MNFIIRVENCVKRYKTHGEKILALDDVSLAIERGDFVALMGDSGSGKSTLLHCMGGLDKPTSGTVVVNDTNLARLSDGALSAFRGKTVGFIFQSFYLQPFLSVKDNLIIAGMAGNIPMKSVKERAAKIINTIGLADRAEHYAKELSGGQIQRVAIGRALINQPDIIIADEPTGNLDKQNADNILHLLKTINKNFGITVVIATHSYDLASSANRIITMQHGKVVL